MGKSRDTGNLVSANNISVDIVNDRVGIGSTSPLEKLHVNGKVFIRENIYFGQGFPSLVNSIKIGKFAGNNDTGGQDNIYIGDNSGISATTTSNRNVYIGGAAGLSATGSDNVIIGYGCDSPIPSGSKQLVIGNQSGSWINGNINYNIGLGSNAPTSKLDVSGEITLSSSPFIRNIPTITSNYTVTSSYNEMSVGPITIGAGVTVTVNSGATWTIV